MFRLAEVEPVLRRETDARIHYEADLAKERESTALLRKREDEVPLKRAYRLPLLSIVNISSYQQ